MIEGISLNNIAIDCKDAFSLRDFYSLLLGWQKQEMYNCPTIVSPSGLTFLFMPDDDFDYVSPVWPEEEGLQQKQMHFDFVVDDLLSAVEYAISIGATKAPEQFGGNDFTVMFDLEGHPFCLCAKD